MISCMKYLEIFSRTPKLTVNIKEYKKKEGKSPSFFLYEEIIFY